MEVITFTLAGETYAIESRYAHEVFRLTDFARIPAAPDLVFGLTTWRGDLLTLFDIRSILGLSKSALNDLTRVIVLGETSAEFGVLADRVHEMISIADDEIEITPGRPYMRGMTRNAVSVLDAGQLLHLRG